MRRRDNLGTGALHNSTPRCGEHTGSAVRMYHDDEPVYGAVLFTTCARVIIKGWQLQRAVTSIYGQHMWMTAHWPVTGSWSTWTGRARSWGSGVQGCSPAYVPHPALVTVLRGYTPVVTWPWGAAAAICSTDPWSTGARSSALGTSPGAKSVRL